MARTTNIAWTKSTLNLAWGCTKVSEECRNCYMYRLSPRLNRDPFKVEILGIDKENYVGYLLRRINDTEGLIFVNSMSDTFHKDIPFSILDQWFLAFEQHSQKQFQILTKRPERAFEYFRERRVPPNCWIGTSVGIKSAKPRIDYLRNIQARIRFLSIEPLLEDLGELDLAGIHWLIIGGESDSKNPRPMQKDWVLNVIKQAKAQNVKTFFKQWGGIGGDNAGGNLCPCCNSIHQEMPI